MSTNAVVSLLSLEVHILSRLLYRNKQQHKHASAFRGLKRLYTEVQALQIEQLEKLHTHAEALIRSIQVERCTSEQIGSVAETLHALKRLSDACVRVLDRCIYTSIELSNTIKAGYFVPLYTFCLAAVGRIAACTHPILQTTSEQHKSLHVKLKSVAVIVPRHAKAIAPILQAAALSQYTLEFLQTVRLDADTSLGVTLDDFSAQQNAAVEQLLGDTGEGWTVPVYSDSEESEDEGQNVVASNAAPSTEAAANAEPASESQPESHAEPQRSTTADSTTGRTNEEEEEKQEKKAVEKEKKKKTTFASFFKQQKQQQEQQRKQKGAKPQQQQQQQQQAKPKAISTTTVSSGADATAPAPKKRKTPAADDPKQKKAKKKSVDDIDAIFDGL